MRQTKKRIAAIFEEQRVFITFNGDSYRYDRADGGFRCFKMNKLAQKMFWKHYLADQIAPQGHIVVWHPVAFCADKANEPVEHDILRTNLLNKYSERKSC